ncbi:MAG: hypothetical protein KAJ95_09385 [Gammaproteobacteria bacterium]|nr:hypothetical protein [Gammaproteobacteria bacterium]
MSSLVRILFCTILAMTMSPAMAVEIEVTMLMFQDRDSQDEPAYMTRILLSKDYVRLDDGEDHGDFALFDRKDGAIYSVSHDEQRTLLITLQPVLVVAPKPLRHDIEVLDTEGVPDIGGQKVARYYFFTNGKRCSEVYAVEGYYEDAVNALSAFSKTLAGQHAKAIDFIPGDIASDCDLANNIFMPDRHLSKGFPIRQKDFSGRSRQLVTIKENVKVDSSIFELPEGYQRFMPGRMSE